MSKDKLHPTVTRFREFINQHPKLRKEIRRTGRSWQEYYEKWILLGEEDEFWDKFKGESSEFKNKTENENENKAELFSQLLKYAEKMDIDKVQKQVHQLSGTIATIQELIDQYQGSRKGPKTQEHNPFGWFRD
ncbi:YlbD family protein [Ornithinibacillus sp. 179-J 7C1 HS]|uniref:YlbD family protein n=1 Tax=Ornithinibacillus sp. 179-J 7C1 HS TaxID=3142384 RepID=UPI0039A1599D